ncbi:MAG: DUF2520 domain-containing protein [Chlorobi bacterium]|nr:DUF2520 domain-containing protein [Chlorobiota bacterium]
MSRPAKIQTVSFIGSGNVSTALALGMLDKGLRVVEVYSPDLTHAGRFAGFTGCNIAEDLSKINKDSDLYILAVPDDKVKEVALMFPEVMGIVAHTSGITPLEALSPARNYGVFYPLQTFTLGQHVNLEEVPFLVEGNTPEVTKTLQELASKLSHSVHNITSGQRKYFHLAAVFVSNFSNHLYSVAWELLEEQDLDFDFLKPLIRQTAAKIDTMPPLDAQTGPARRDDRKALDEHLKMLENHPELKELYKLISGQITKKYHE